LRHIERTRLLVHLVDVSDESDRDPAEDFEVILRELGEFDESLVTKPMIVVASKIDACQDLSRVDAVKAKAAEHKLPFYAISSATGAGIEELRYAMSAQLVADREKATISVGS
jgi:GTPase